jgi:hypothetical protein
MRRRLSLVDGFEYIFGIGIKINDSINKVEREEDKSEASYSGMRNRRLTVISCSDTCSDWWDYPVILAGSPVETL